MKGKNFIICGLTGWCIEIVFTSTGALLKKDKKMMGKTSAWMFPIYGMAAGIGVIAPKISHWSTFRRGLFYGGAIMGAEFVTGSLLKRLDACPWSYEGCKYAVKDLVRLDYLPFWMAAGLLYEKLLLNIESDTTVSTM